MLYAGVNEYWRTAVQGGAILAVIGIDCAPRPTTKADGGAAMRRFAATTPGSALLLVVEMALLAPLSGVRFTSGDAFLPTFGWYANDLVDRSGADPDARRSA